ncbi:GMC family oxidoreductase [Rhodohalobacter sp. SW132]|uniref:GMC family oxidoreductase n=1 Tax=Rhodohalobacter sp. SW132 TaxID=2293433 RepID=UPI000E237E25|nr:GMC family oxidoreductase [Rhodohalobacter sp. SW132]REL24187.1 GMC family oxidoreductase [Rhodohalobacter sp. SW132]
MIIDANESENTKKDLHTDICVVGAGIAGIAFAREIAKSGKEVLLLESGGLEPKDSAQELNSGKNTGRPYYELNEARERAFGGSSHMWHVDKEWQINTGSLPEEIVRLRGMDAIDFRKREWVPYSGWPISKDDLDPYYSQAHELFKIGPYQYEADFWEEKLGLKKIPFRKNRVKTTVFQFARNNIFYTDYRRELEASDNITVYLNATALEIKLRENAKSVASVKARSSAGNEFTVNATTYVLAQGGLETPRLMLLSNNVMNMGVGNHNDLVGRFFMEHPHLWTGKLIPSDQQYFQNGSLYGLNVYDSVPFLGKIVLSDDVMKEERLMNHSLNILHRIPMASLLKPSRAFHGLKKSFKTLDISRQMVRDFKTLASNVDVVSYAAWNKIAQKRNNKGYQRTNKFDGYQLNIMSEQAPNPNSRVILGQERDAFGQHKMNLSWEVSRDDMRSMRRFLEIINRELKKDSLGEIISLPSDDSVPDSLHGGYHHMGTTRMSDDPKQGVVDKNCRVHGMNNLYVAGSSVFPTCGYANPTLTLAALTLRLADHLK